MRVEREPITEANRGDATSGPGISEEEHEVVLHEERPVVEKEAVPVERVRLDTETVTDQVTVNEEVRKEQIDTDVDGVTDTGVQPDRVADLSSEHQGRCHYGRHRPSCLFGILAIEEGRPCAVPSTRA